MNDERVFRITLVRHGESVGNAEERLQGHADFPLSERGRAQVQALAQRWIDESVRFDHVVASPLQRAVETARMLTLALSGPDPEIDSLWIEQDAGENAGLSWESLDAGAVRERDSVPRAAAHGVAPGASGAESDAALAERARQALDSLLSRAPGRYLVVSHRAFLNAVLFAILGSPGEAHASPATFRIANGSFTRARFDEASGRWRIDVVGDRAHWRDG